MFSFDSEIPDSDDLDDAAKHAQFLEVIEWFEWITGCPQTWTRDCNAILALWAVGADIEFVRLHVRVCEECRNMVAGKAQPKPEPKHRFKLKLLGLGLDTKSNGHKLASPGVAAPGNGNGIGDAEASLETLPPSNAKAEASEASRTPAAPHRFRRRALLAACICVGALLPLFLVSKWTGLFQSLSPTSQNALRTVQLKIQSGGVGYINGVLSGTDELAKRKLIVAVWQLQLSSYYTNLAPALGSPDLATRQAVIVAYQSIPSGYLLPIQATISAACNTEPDSTLRSRLSAILSSLSQ